MLAPVEWYGWLSTLVLWLVFGLGLGAVAGPLLYFSVAALIPRWRRARGWQA